MIYLVLANSIPQSAWTYEWEAETERDEMEQRLSTSAVKYIFTVQAMRVLEK